MQSQDVLDLETTTLGDLLNKYAAQVSTLKRGAKPERYRIAKIAQAELSSTPITKLTSKMIADYRDDRLRTVGRSTIRNELSIIRRALEVARREWGLELPENPAALVTLPRPSEARDRRLEPGELEKLEDALADKPLVRAIVRFAIETAMRRGEILGLKWRNVDMRKRLARISHTKTGSPRTVPLTDGALEILKGVGTEGETVFPVSESQLRYAWDQACKKAKLMDLHFHDLRHEGVSRFFEIGLSVPEVSILSGHRTPSMLFRYTNLRPYELAMKLRGRRWKPLASLEELTGNR